MSKGKYSPVCPHSRDRGYEYKFNPLGKEPEPYDPETMVYDEIRHSCWYDDEGYDMYGYSCFDVNGDFVGGGEGIDRLGYTEWDYLTMSDEEYNNV